MLKKIKTQQEDYLHRPVNPDDYVYMTKTNLMNTYLPHPGKVSRWSSDFQGRMNKFREKENLEPLPHVRLHDMRHTFISLCLNGGVNRFQVSANCGHTFSREETNTTVSTYWHDDGNRSEILGFVNRIIQVSIEQ